MMSHDVGYPDNPFSAPTASMMIFDLRVTTEVPVKE